MKDLAEAYRRLGRVADADAVDERVVRALSQEVGCDKRKALSLGDKLNRNAQHQAAVDRLRDVFGVMVIAGKLVRDAIHHRPVSLHEPMERRMVPGRSLGDQLRICRHQ